MRILDQYFKRKSRNSGFCSCKVSSIFCSFSLLLNLEDFVAVGFSSSKGRTSIAARGASIEIKFPEQVVNCAESRFWTGSLFYFADFWLALLIFRLFLSLELDDEMTKETLGIGSEIGC